MLRRNFTGLTSRQFHTSNDNLLVAPCSRNSPASAHSIITTTLQTRPTITVPCKQLPASLTQAGRQEGSQSGRCSMHTVVQIVIIEKLSRIGKVHMMHVTVPHDKERTALCSIHAQAAAAVGLCSALHTGRTSV